MRLNFLATPFYTAPRLDPTYGKVLFCFSPTSLFMHSFFFLKLFFSKFMWSCATIIFLQLFLRTVQLCTMNIASRLRPRIHMANCFFSSNFFIHAFLFFLLKLFFSKFMCSCATFYNSSWGRCSFAQLITWICKYAKKLPDLWYDFQWYIHVYTAKQSGACFKIPYNRLLILCGPENYAFWPKKAI